MDKNSNGGVKVSVTLYFFLKTEMTKFHSPKQKGRLILYPYSNKRLIQYSLVVLFLRCCKCCSVQVKFDFSKPADSFLVKNKYRMSL